MRYRWWIASSLIGCICLLTATFVFRNEPPQLETTLSDGTIVRFEKAGKGIVSFDSYTRLKAVLADYVPNRFQSRLGERSKGSFTIQPNNIGLLFSLGNIDGKRNQDTTQFLSRIEFIESTGFVFSAEVSGYSAQGNRVLFNEAAFPRRDSMLHMRCYEQETDRLLFDLNFPNPFYPQTFPDWSPESVPASQTVDPLTVTLKHGMSDFKQKYVLDEDLEITSTDPRWTDLKPQRNFWLNDATGNQAQTLDGLSPFEPAWKLTILIRRNLLAEFGADEVWRTGRFALPDALTVERLNLMQTVAGVELGATILCSAGTMNDDGNSLTVTPTEHTGKGTSQESGSNNGRTYSKIHSGLPFIQLTHPLLDAVTELIVTVRDQNGTRISVGNGVWYGMNNGYMRMIQFEPTPETTDIELEVIVNRGRTFEFLVAPPEHRKSSDTSK